MYLPQLFCRSVRVLCVVTFPCGRRSQDRLYKHDRRTENLTDFNRYDIINIIFLPYLIKAIKIIDNNVKKKNTRKTLIETGLVIVKEQNIF